MLSRLKIQNFALIDQVEIEFNQGFTTITGETGAGKSIILKALELVLGARADLGLIKNQEQKSVIEAVFQTNENLRDLFEALDLDYWTESVLRREINASGKSRMFINDTPVNLSSLKLIGDQLLQIHTQHQNYELRKNNFSLKLLDKFGALESELKLYQKEYAALRTLEKDFDVLQQEIVEASKEQSFLQFQLEEINQLNLDEDFEKLQQQFDRLENAQDLTLNLEAVKAVLDGDDAVISNLSLAIKKVDDLLRIDPELKMLGERLKSSKIELQDIADELETHLPDDLNDDDRIVLEDKLNIYNGLIKKHFLSDQSELLELKRSIQEKLDLISISDTKLTELEEAINVKKKYALHLANALSDKRKNLSVTLSNQLVQELKDMSMEGTSINFEFKRLPDVTSNGIDEAECLISVNKGLKPGPIEKTISGGEMSRFMLATQHIVSTRSALPTMIFDEIDTGVSGNVANQMAEKMKAMSRSLQVLSITHLPQVAALGQSQLKVIKKNEGDRTVSDIKHLNHEERIEEIAALISGAAVSKEAREHAKQLLG